MTDDNRITDHPHITLVHQASLKSASEGDAKRLWDVCNQIKEEVPVEFRLSHLIYNSRIMALVVEPTSISEANSPQFTEILKTSKLLKTSNSTTLERLHVTVGTASSGVKPVEAGELVLKWRNKKLSPGEGDVIPLSDADSLSGKVEGLWS
jgi:tRNA ligase